MKKSKVTKRRGMLSDSLGEGMKGSAWDLLKIINTNKINN